MGHPARAGKRLLRNLLYLCAGCGAAALPKTSFAQAPRLPVEAELVRWMEAGRIKSGDAIYAKVKSKWEDGNCLLRPGAILKGRVVAESAHSKNAKVSEIALLFESGECRGREMTRLPLTVAAVLEPDDDKTGDGSQYAPLSDAVGLTMGGSGGAMRGVSEAAATAIYQPSRRKQPVAVLPGQVVGIRGVTLSVGSGPEGSSVLRASGRNVRLEAGSQLVLVRSTLPGGGVLETAKPALGNIETAPEAETFGPQPSDIPDETEPCAPPGCNIALPAADASRSRSQTMAAVSVKELGYGARATNQMYRFDHDAAIAYLGPRKLLFTFNPHELVKRSVEEAAYGGLRVIRGAVIDLNTMKVEQRVDWRVQDEKQYLWPIAGDRVMVHVGRELRIYGPGLKLEQRIALGGALAFVRVSPSSTYFAVGVLQERHSKLVHAELTEAEAKEPEEDLKLEVLDAKFQVLATTARSSRDAAPVLLDEGEIRVPTIGRNRWRIVESTWTGRRRVLAQVNSSCRPAVATLAPGLLFVIGCDRQESGKWYRMIRPDGRSVLKGWSSSAELELSASGAGGSFVIGIAKAARALMADFPFGAADLESQQFGVYRAENGQSLLAVSVPAPVPTQQSYSLSPSGDQLAVLQADQIVFYAVRLGASPK